jgi:hypothetical protein
MAVFSEKQLLASNLGSAYDTMGNETFLTEDGKTLGGKFTLISVEPSMELVDKSTDEVAEIRFLEPDAATSTKIGNENILVRVDDGEEWLIDGTPDADQLGEVICRVIKTNYNRIGGR